MFDANLHNFTTKAIKEILAANNRDIELLTRVLEHLRGFLNADSIVLYRYDNKSRIVFLESFSGQLHEPMLIAKSRKITLDPLLNYILNSEQPYFVRDTQLDTLFSNRTFVKREKIRSCIGISLQLEGEKNGLIFINFRRQIELSAKTFGNLGLASGLISGLIDGIYQTLPSNYAMATAHGINAALQSGEGISLHVLSRNLIAASVYILGETDPTLKDSVKVVCAYLVPFENGRFGRVLAVAPDIFTEKVNLEIDSVSGNPAKLGIMGRALRVHKTENIADVSSDGDYLAISPLTRSQLSIPLISDDQILGVFTIEHALNDGFTQEDERNIQILVSQVIIAFQQYQVISKLRTTHQALTSLTNMLILNNYDATSLTLVIEIAKAIECDYTILLLFDPDTRRLKDIVAPDGHHALDVYSIFEIQNITNFVGKLLDERTISGAEDVSDVPEFYPLIPFSIDPQTKIASSVLHVGDTLLGVLLCSRDRLPFEPAELETIELFANHGAIAIHNAIAYGERINQIQILEALKQRETDAKNISSELLNQLREVHSISVDLHKASSEDEIVAITLDTLVRVFEFHYAALSLVDFDSNQIVTKNAISALPDQISVDWYNESRYPLDDKDILADRIRVNRSEVVDKWDERLNSEIYQKYGHDRLIRAYIPIRARPDDSAIGVVEAGYLKSPENNIQPLDLEDMERFAAQTAIALDNLHDKTIAVQRLSILEELHLLARELATAEPAMDRVTQLLADTIRRLFKADFVVVLPYQEGREFIKEWKGIAPKELLNQMTVEKPKRSGITNAVFQHGVIEVNNVETETRFTIHSSFVRQNDVNSFLAVRMRYRDRNVGVIFVDYHSTRQFNIEEKKLLENIADLGAGAIEYRYRLSDKGMTEHIISRSELEFALSRAQTLDNIFQYTVAHDIRTLLYLIQQQLLSLEQIIQPRYKGKQQRHELSRNTIKEFRTIHDRVDGVIEAIGEFLKVSETNLLESEVDAGPTNVNNSIRSALRLSKPRFDTVQAEVSVLLHPEPIFVEMNSTWVLRIIVNLIQNATKAIDSLPATRKSIIVTSALTTDERTAIITVRDTGVGIKSERYGDLFIPGKSYWPNRQPGTGWGLAIIQRLLGSYKGRIDISSSYGEGTTVTVQIPTTKVV